MEYDKLTPSDFGLANMIGSLTQQDVKPEVNEDNTYTIRFKLLADAKTNDAILAAVEGRAGKRLVSLNVVDGEVTAVVGQSEEHLPQYAAPNKYTEPYPEAGLRYCKRLDECRALEVRRDNVEQLILFVGGGELEAPEDGPATFHFLNASGSVWAHAREGEFIVAERPGLFKIIPSDEFKKVWERKW